mgnify:CR=1 FL=1
MQNNTIRPNYYASMPIEPHLLAEQESYNVGTAMVYLMRAGLKGDAIEDLQKAITHLEFEKEIKGYPEIFKKINTISYIDKYPENIHAAIYDLSFMHLEIKRKDKSMYLDCVIDYINAEIERIKKERENANK